MRFKLTAILLTVLLSATSIAFAQTVTGTVFDAQTKQPLPGTNIIQQGTKTGTSTDSTGHFILNLDASARPVIVVSFVGYQTKAIDLEGKSKTAISVALVPTRILSGAVQVEALRVDSKSAITYENISQKEIKNRNFGQDVPYLLKMTPSVVTTSDAGNGVGYTGIRIRGVDPTRINVTLNGIPVNDAEEQAVYWVDLPDIASSIQSIQIQRGVGTSTNGAGAFGASLNIQTGGVNPNPFGEVNASYGSFRTRKFNIKMGTGLLKNGWTFSGRLSQINSDGYIERAWSNLRSAFLSGVHQGKKSLLQVNMILGKEKTYQAWYGVSGAIIDTNRRYNPYTYDNQTDNYWQNYYQALYSYQLRENWTVNGALFLTTGKGYYEEYEKDQNLQDYGLQPVVIGSDTVRTTDLIRRQWLDNDFFGMTYSTNYKQGNRWKLDVGGAYNIYLGGHFGRVIWARYFSNGNIRHTYYYNNANKKDFNSYAKFSYNLTPKLRTFTDFQLRRISYDFLGNGVVKINGKETIVPARQQARLTFFNPKAGLNYDFTNRQRVYASVSVGHKEPGRDEYVESTPQSRPKPEALYDLETGYRYSSPRLFLGLTGYLMYYHDQLILTGQINDVGAYIRKNVPRSYRMGVELQASVPLLPHLQWAGNATISRNKIIRYNQYIDNYDTGGQTVRTYHQTNIAFSPDLILHSILEYREGDFTAQFQTRYISRQYLDNTSHTGRSLDPYFVNDLRFHYDLGSLWEASDVELGCLLNNIFNELYSSNGYTYDYISGGQLNVDNYYYPQAGRNFLAQIRIRF